jgi:hypothetical protein
LFIGDWEVWLGRSQNSPEEAPKPEISFETQPALVRYALFSSQSVNTVVFI